MSEHLDFVWRLLRRMGLSPSDAQDAAQQVFMRAARELDRLPPASERAFLYGTGQRIAASARRSLRRRVEAPGELPELEAAGAAPVELGRAADVLDELLGRLPDELRRVLVLAELEDITVAAIAELEEVPLGTAASRLRRARAAFERCSRELVAVNHSVAPMSEARRGMARRLFASARGDRAPARLRARVLEGGRAERAPLGPARCDTSPTVRGAARLRLVAPPPAEGTLPWSRRARGALLALAALAACALGLLAVLWALRAPPTPMSSAETSSRGDRGVRSR